MSFTEFPGWEALHPFVAHFPVALLLVAPVFIVIGLLCYSRRQGYFVSALILMTLGTLGLFPALATGVATAQAAGALSGLTRSAAEAIEHHRCLAEATLTIFAVLTIIFYVVMAVPHLLKREVPRLNLTLLYSVYLILYLSGTLMLIETAWGGVLLVHRHGVLVPM